MRSTLPLVLLVPSGLVQGAANITKTELVDTASDKAELGWGASGLAFGYSAGVGLNFSKSENLPIY